MSGVTFSILFIVYTFLLAFATGWHEMFFQDLREGRRNFKPGLDKMRKGWLVAMQVIAVIFPVAMYQTFAGDDYWQWWANYLVAVVMFAFFRYWMVSFFVNRYVFERGTFDLSNDKNANATTDEILNNLSYGTRKWGTILGMIVVVALFVVLNTIWYWG